MLPSKAEIKIIGSNYIWITIVVMAIYYIAFITGGDLINWEYLGLEIVFPFYLSIMISENVKIKADPMYEILIVETRNFFLWILRRFVYVFVVISLIVIGSIYLMNICSNFYEAIIAFLGTSFVFSSIAIVSSYIFKNEHSAACVCGTVWIFFLLIRSLVRIPFVAMVYPFLRFVDETSETWIANKMNLIIIGCILWSLVFLYTVCRGRRLTHMLR